MKTIQVANLDQLLQTLHDAEHDRYHFEPQAGAGIRKQHLYRGVGRMSYSLKSTLERSGLSTLGELSVREYLARIEEMKPQLESLSGKSWAQVDESKAATFYHKEAWYEDYPYMTYLRHHGYPSPLLDWTASPYIAAYFAFASERNAEGDAEPVSIFVIKEDTPPQGQMIPIGEPHIRVLGSRVRTHHRHFRQQSRYTVCVKHVNNEWVYVPHVPYIKDMYLNSQPLWRIDVPYSIREEALAHLRKLNINEFSLFDTDEALLKSIYFEQCARQYFIPK